MLLLVILSKIFGGLSKLFGVGNCCKLPERLIFPSLAGFIFSGPPVRTAIDTNDSPFIDPCIRTVFIYFSSVLLSIV